MASIRKLPLHGGLVGAVHLEPEGLRLARPATLTIAPTRARTRPQRARVRLTGFTYRASGKELRPYASKAGGAISLRIAHFSGYGLGLATEADRAALTGALRAEAIATMTLLRGAQADVTRLEAALYRYYTWKLGVQGFLGFLPELSADYAQVVALARQVFGDAVDRARQRCSSRHDISHALHLIPVLELAGRLGLVELAASPALLERCLQFELDFETQLTQTGPADVVARSHVRVQGLGLRWNRERRDWTGTKPLELSFFKYSQPSAEGGECWFTWDGVDLRAPFEVVSLRITVPPSTGAPARPRIELTFFPGFLHEIFTHHCRNAGSNTNPWITYVHGMQLLYGEAPAITDWAYLGGTAWARRTGTKSAADDSMSVSEQTTFELKHVPRP